MGIVSQARDLELGGAVALKLIWQDLTYDPEILQRFKQELLLASKVAHRNILVIRDAKCISMATRRCSVISRIVTI